MLRGRYAPVPRQAAMIDKVWPDTQEFQKRELDSNDNVYRQKAYQFTGKADLSIMPGELCVARRGQIQKKIHGKGQRKVVSTTNGLYYGNASVEGIMRDYDFAGVALSEFQWGGDNLFGMDPMEHGFGVNSAGPETVNAPFHQDLHAGDLVAWRFKSPPRTGDPRSQNVQRPHSVDTGLNPRASLNREGTPFTKDLIELEVFEPSDFSFQLAGAYDLLRKPYSAGGISDLNLTHLLGSRKELTTLQEEALSWAYGLLILAARADADPLGRMREFGLLGNQISPAGLQALDRMFLRNVTPGQNTIAINELQVDSFARLSLENEDEEERSKFLADNAFLILCSGIAGAWMEKARRIIGKSMGSFKPPQSPDIMLNAGKVGH